MVFPIKMLINFSKFKGKKSTQLPEGLLQPRASSQQWWLQLNRLLHLPLCLMAEREMKHKTLRFHAAKGNCGSKGACGRASLDLTPFLMSRIKKSSYNLVETILFEIQLANLQFRSCYRVRLRNKSEVRSFFKLRHLTLKLWFLWKK